MGRFEDFFDSIPGMGLVIMVATCLVVAVIAGIIWLVSLQPLLVGIPLLVLLAYGLCCLIAGITLDY